MILAFVLYSTLVATALGAAALLVECGSRGLRWPLRWVWVGALAASLAVPAVAWQIQRGSMHGEGAAPLETSAGTLVSDASAVSLEASARSRVGSLLATFHGRVGNAVARLATSARALDRPLLALWGLATLAMAAILASAYARLARARRNWGCALLDDQIVRVSDDIGPAVVGFLRREIVLPVWAMRMSDGPRAMLLAHEQEHVRAFDPVLLLMGLFALVLVPWNPAMWWQLRRLRLAVEIDCDARVLRRCQDVRAYGALLLEVGRRTARSPLAAAAFSEPATHLERRITMMLARTPRWPIARAALLAAAAGGIAIVACDMQPPVAPAPQNDVALETLGANGSSYNVSEGMGTEALEAALRAHVPEVFDERDGRQWIVQFVLDSEGRIVQSGKVLVVPRVALEARVVPRAGDALAVAAEAFGERTRMVVRRRETLQRAREAIRGELAAGDLTAAEPQVLEERTYVELRATAEGSAISRARVAAPEGEARMEEVLVARTGLLRLRADAIESVEVVKGQFIERIAPSVQGVIWIRLKEGASIP